MKRSYVRTTGLLAIGFGLYFTLTFPRNSCGEGDSADPTGIWMCAGSLPIARSELAAAALGTIIYAAGGLNRWGRSRAFESYDTETRTWRQLPSTPTVVHHAALAALGGKMYMSGGYEDLTLSRPLNSAWSYDIAIHRWSRIADMPETRAAHGMVSVGGRLYVIGGDSSTAEPASVLVYDPTSDRWRRLTTRLPTLREHLCVVGVGDKIYALGGRWRGTNLNVVEVYDASSNSWMIAQPMPTARSGFAAGYLSGRVHVFGGESLTSLKTFAAHEIYDPVLNSWSRIDSGGPASRHGVASAVIDGQWFVLGGAICAGYYTPFTTTRSMAVFRPH
jgi:N-acetylneuraminic acid mutarotase